MVFPEMFRLMALLDPDEVPRNKLALNAANCWEHQINRKWRLLPGSHMPSTSYSLLQFQEPRRRPVCTERGAARPSEASQTNMGVVTANWESLTWRCWVIRGTRTPSTTTNATSENSASDTLVRGRSHVWENGSTAQETLGLLGSTPAGVLAP